jgi:hypothetical protein
MTWVTPSFNQFALFYSLGIGCANGPVVHSQGALNFQQIAYWWNLPQAGKWSILVFIRWVWVVYFLAGSA